MDFEQQIFTVKLEEAPLRSVFERIKREKHLWIKGSRFLLDEKVSVQFKDLSINASFLINTASFWVSL